MADGTSKKTEGEIDESLEDTFPASDPPSNTPIGGTKKSKEIASAHEAGGDSPSGGPPGDDRHATETAAGRQDGAEPAETHEKSQEK